LALALSIHNKHNSETQTNKDATLQQISANVSSSGIYFYI